VVGAANPWTRRYLQTGWDRQEPAEVDWASGALLLVRRRTFEQLGGFDERFFMFMEDVDLCWRAQVAGWTVGIEPAAEAVHVVGASRAARPYRMILAHHRSLLRFARRSTTGPRRALLPLIGAGLAVRTVLAWVQRVLRRRPPAAP